MAHSYSVSTLIHMCHSLFRSESPSQVFLILIQWLVSLVKANGGKKQHVALAYDNMCNLPRIKAAKAPLPFPPPLDKLWLDVEKVIDVFHFKNHISAECQKKFSPAKLKEEHPNFNTQAGEQTFVWVHRFVFYEQNSPFILPTSYGS